MPTNSLLLSAEERARFIAWLENEAATTGLLVKQMETLGPAFQVIIARLQQEGLAASVIAHKLRSTHSETLG